MWFHCKLLRCCCEQQAAFKRGRKKKDCEGQSVITIKQTKTTKTSRFPRLPVKQSIKYYWCYHQEENIGNLSRQLCFCVGTHTFLLSFCYPGCPALAPPRMLSRVVHYCPGSIKSKTDMTTKCDMWFWTGFSCYTIFLSGQMISMDIWYQWNLRISWYYCINIKVLITWYVEVIQENIPVCRKYTLKY